MRKRACVVVLVIACGPMAASGVPRARTADQAMRVLFIGNSLTKRHDLPDLVRQLAVGARRAFEYRVVAFDGYSLEDHWNRGDARRAIADGGWTFVVLQQGPSALPDSRRLLVDYARRFDAEARRVGARTALFMVWPAMDRRGDFEGVSQSYAAAARATGGVLLPAGDAWRAALRRDDRLALYGPDGFHPTVAGSYLAALVVFETFFPGAPAAGPRVVAPDVARALQSAIDEARGHRQ
jgi:hypothetical protein